MFTIQVKLGKQISKVKVNSSTKIQNVLQTACDINAIPIDSYNLFFKFKPLRLESTIAECDIRANDIIEGTRRFECSCCFRNTLSSSPLPWKNRLRLLKEKELVEKNSSYCIVEWENDIIIDMNTEGKYDVVRIKMQPNDFPFKGPRLIIESQILHPCIKSDGTFSFGREISGYNWNCKTTLLDILNKIKSILNDEDILSYANSVIKGDRCGNLSYSISLITKQQ